MDWVGDVVVDYVGNMGFGVIALQWRLNGSEYDSSYLRSYISHISLYLNISYICMS